MILSFAVRVGFLRISGTVSRINKGLKSFYEELTSPPQSCVSMELPGKYMVTYNHARFVWEQLGLSCGI